MQAREKIVLIGGLDRSLLNFRGELIRDIVAAGHSLVAAAPLENDDVPDGIAALGARFRPIRLNRTSLNPLGEIFAGRSIRALIEDEQPDVVLAYTIKPVIHGLRAAERAGVSRRYALITGLGAAFNSRGLKGSIMEWVATQLYTRALRRASAVMVQNADIARFLRERHVVGSSVPLTVLPGSGVDLAHHAVRPLPEGAPVFVILSRLLRDKGIVEFVEAARLVKQRVPNAVFRVVGAQDHNPAAIPPFLLQHWKRDGLVEFCPQVSDVCAVLETCTVGVLPSYHEGLPRSLLEAMSTGRPVITTDTIGCKETVVNPGAADAAGIRTGENGLLVPVRSVEPLAAAMLRLANNPDLCARMGQRGREFVEERFDVRLINRQMLEAMDLLPVFDNGSPLASRS